MKVNCSYCGKELERMLSQAKKAKNISVTKTTFTSTEENMAIIH